MIEVYKVCRTCAEINEVCFREFMWYLRFCNLEGDTSKIKYVVISSDDRLHTLSSYLCGIELVILMRNTTSYQEFCDN